MKVAGSIALVTGANRGLGLAFAKALVEMGAAKVYAAARNPEAVTLKGVVPLKLDVTSDEDVAAAARAAANVNLLVNNAGIARPGGFLADGAVEAAREQFEVNFVGPLRMARAFAPVLAKNGGGAIINVLSIASWMNGPAGDLWRVEISRMGANQRPSHRACATGHPGRRAACRLHRHRPRPQYRRAEEFARGNRADDARRPRTRGRPGLGRRDHPPGASRSIGGSPAYFQSTAALRSRAGLPMAERANCPFNRRLYAWSLAGAPASYGLLALSLVQVRLAS